MDLIFKRYSSPFILLDNYLRLGRFDEFVDEVIKANNEDETYKVWLLKVHDKSYEEFREEVLNSSKNKASTPEQIKATISESKNILNGFNPNQKGGN